MDTTSLAWEKKGIRRCDEVYQAWSPLHSVPRKGSRGEFSKLQRETVGKEPIRVQQAQISC